MPDAPMRAARRRLNTQSRYCGLDAGQRFGGLRVSWLKSSQPPTNAYVQGRKGLAGSKRHHWSHDAARK